MPTNHRDGTHGATDHAHGGPAATPPVHAGDVYCGAGSVAQPDVGRAVVVIDLEAREFDWDIAPGSTVRAWGFNGQVPGPTIEGRVGDVLEVRLTNHLPEATTIHWHGLRVSAPMDGTEATQRPVPPGESFTYRFRLPDAGTFWYHPHINEVVQIGRGLYGPLIVRAHDEPRLDGEQVLVIGELTLDQPGQWATPGGHLERYDDRAGSSTLVTGKREPILTIAAGQIERWRIVNASSARCLRLSIGGATFQILGTDGGLLEAPVAAREVLLAVSDRVEIALGPFEEDDELAVEGLPYWGDTAKRRMTERLALVQVGPAKRSAGAIPERLRTITPLAAASASPMRTVDFGSRLRPDGGMDFVVNDEKHHQDAPVKVGELQVWDIVNSTAMDHPFHLHGFFFQVLAVNGEPPAWRSWEDVINLPPRSTTRIAWMPDDRPGRWMYHCHILGHHAAGMMAHFDVVR